MALAPAGPVYAFMFVDLPLRAGEARRGARSMAAVYAIVAYDLGRARNDRSGCGCRRPEGAPLDGRVRRAAPARRRGRAVREHGRRVGAGRRPARAIFPDAVAQRCLVHLVRNSCKYVPSKDMQAVPAATPGLLRRAVGFPRAGGRSPILGRGRATRRGGDVGGRRMAEVERLPSHGPGRQEVSVTPPTPSRSVNASFRKVVRRGAPRRGRRDEAALPAGEELYSRWGEGCHQPGCWARCATSCCATRAQGEDREVPVKRLTQTSPTSP